MKKSLFSLLFLLTIGSLFLFRQQLIDQFFNPTVQLTEDAKAMIVLDAENGQILFRKNHEDALPIASMSKMMTQYIVLSTIERGAIQWDQQYTPSEDVLNIAAQPHFSNLQMTRSQSYSIRELFTAMSVNSSNDATVALAEIIGGTETHFVTMMNEQAKHLGLEHAYFYNATGLDGPYLGNSPEETNRASAYDTAKLAQALIERHPDIRSFASMPHFTSASGRTLWNTNLLLPGMAQAFDGIDGLKTGYTDLAGACFASTGVFNGRRVITVVMDVAPSGQDHTSPKFILTRELIEQIVM